MSDDQMRSWRPLSQVNSKIGQLDNRAEYVNICDMMRNKTIVIYYDNQLLQY